MSFQYNSSTSFVTSDAPVPLLVPLRASSNTSTVPCRLRYTLYAGPRSMRNSSTPSRTDLQSPKLPILNRSSWARVVARTLEYLNFDSHLSKGLVPFESV